MSSTEQLLVDVIRAEPDVWAGYAVYADWLMQRGDARGELIGCHEALERQPTDVGLQARAAELVEQVCETLPLREHLTLGWKRGFIHALWLDPIALADACDGDRIDALFDHPLLQLVEQISLHPHASTWPARRALFARPNLEHGERHRCVFARVNEAIPPALVRRLEVGDLASNLFESASDMHRALARFPRLRELRIHTRTLEPECLAMLAPTATHLEVAVAEPDEPLLRTIAMTSWPRLRRLVVEVPRSAGEPYTWPLDGLMKATGVPALVDLRLLEVTCGDLTERLFTELPTAAIVKQLEVLDFTFKNADMREARPIYPALAHIETLLPSAEDEDEETIGHHVYFLHELDGERVVGLARRGLSRTRVAGWARHSLGKQLGSALTSVGRYDEALEALDASLALDPGCGMTLVERAAVFARTGRIDDCLTSALAAEAASQHKGRRSTILYYKGRSMMALGDSRGRAVLQEAAQLYRDGLGDAVERVDAELRYDYACTLGLLGDPQAAALELAASIALCSRLARSAEVEPALASVPQPAGK